ncbi:MAG: hypothetical protein OXB98_14280 [Bryobacterales bacterium]|nr:hypothetical protein [Bryobacterales bacterium]
MSENERHEMLRTVSEAHASLEELALRLRRRLGSKAPALQAAVKAEQEMVRLRRELQQLVVDEPEFPSRRGPSREGRRGGKAVDTDRLRR